MLRASFGFLRLSVLLEGSEYLLSPTRYGIRAQAISVSFDRTQVAMLLGRATDFSRLEPRGSATCDSSLRRAARQDSTRGITQILYPGYVPLPFGGRSACWASRGVHGH